MSDERVQYDGDTEHLDEIVAENVTVHIENLDAHNYMIRIWREDGIEVHLNGKDLTEMDSIDGLPVIMRPPLELCHEWKDRKGRRHQCDGPHKPGAVYHRCDCGAQKEIQR